MTAIPKKLPPKRRESIAKQVVAEIVSLIQGGSLEPGDRLPSERALAGQLGIGRPALREALRALEILGILTIRHGGGIFVSALTPEKLFGPLHLYVGLNVQNFDAIIDARKIIEGGILESIAADFPTELLERLNNNVDSFEKALEARAPDAIDLEQIQDLAQEFREIIKLAIDNPILLRALEGLDLLSAAARTVLDGKSGAGLLVQSHRRVVAALNERDSDAAKRAVIAHLDLMHSLYPDSPDKSPASPTESSPTD